MLVEATENENLKEAIEELMETINEKELTIIKASNIIENLKTDFEAVLKQLRTREQEKEDIQKENNLIFKENQSLQKEVNQAHETYRKYEDKMKKLHRIIESTEQRERKLQQSEQILINEKSQLQIQIEDLKKDLHFNIEMVQELTQQYQVKETGFTNAFEMIRQYEIQVAQQIEEINKLKKEKKDQEEQYKKELETIKRVTQNLVKTHQQDDLFINQNEDQQQEVAFFKESKRKSRNNNQIKSNLKRNSSTNLKGRMSSKENIMTEAACLKTENYIGNLGNPHEFKTEELKEALLLKELEKQLTREKNLVSFLEIQSANQIQFIEAMKSKQLNEQNEGEKWMMKCNDLETQLFEADLKSANLSTIIHDYQFAYQQISRQFNNLYTIIINYIEQYSTHIDQGIDELQQIDCSEKITKIMSYFEELSHYQLEQDSLINQKNLEMTIQKKELDQISETLMVLMRLFDCETNEQLKNSIIQMFQENKQYEQLIQQNASKLLETQINQLNKQLIVLENEHFDALKKINNLEAQNIQLSSSLKKLKDEIELEQFKNFTHEQDKEQLKSTITRAQRSGILPPTMLQEINLKSTMNIEKDFYRAKEENNQSILLLEKTLDDLENLQLEKENILERLHFSEEENQILRSDLQKIKFQLDQLNTIMAKQLNENIKFLNTGRIQTNDQRELFSIYPFFKTFRHFHEAATNSIITAYSYFNQLFLLLTNSQGSEGQSLLDIKHYMNNIPKQILQLIQQQFGTFTLGPSPNQELIKLIQFTNEIAVRLLEIQDSKDSLILERLEKIISNQKHQYELYYNKSNENNTLVKNVNHKQKSNQPLSIDSSLFNSQASIKQFRDLQTLSCQTLISIFKIWKEQMIAIAELFYEISLSIKLLTENNKIDIDELSKKISRCFEIIQSQKFMHSVQSNFDQLEFSVQDFFEQSQ